MKKLDNQKTLVLNADYLAIGVISTKRAFVLVMQDKAELVSESVINKLRTIYKDFVAPAVIRLKSFIQVPFKKVPLSRHNIYKRDGYECQYCGSKKNLTLDHVCPRSRGGKDTWTNMVTACFECNSAKGDKLLSETDMKLAKQPHRPSFIVFLNKLGDNFEDSWNPFLFM